MSVDLNIGIHRAQVEEFRKHRTRFLTLVFTDIVGSTALKQGVGRARGRQPFPGLPRAGPPAADTILRERRDRDRGRFVPAGVCQTVGSGLIRIDSAVGTGDLEPGTRDCAPPTGWHPFRSAAGLTKPGQFILSAAPRVEAQRSPQKKLAQGLRKEQTLA